MLAFVRAARGKVSVDWANPLNTKRSGPNEPLSVDVKRQKFLKSKTTFLKQAICPPISGEREKEHEKSGEGKSREEKVQETSRLGVKEGNRGKLHNLTSNR